MKSVFSRLKTTLVDSKLPIVEILGNDRGGTSLVANFVHAIGVDLGHDLNPANEWNVLSYTRNNLRAIVDYDRWFDSGLQQARTLVKSLNLSQPVSEQQIANAVNDIVQSALRHYYFKQDAIRSPKVAGFYSLLRQTAIDGKIPDEIWAITETFEKARDLLIIWDDLV